MRLLCIRFSAIGDVAMTVPVVKALAVARPDIHVIMVSRPFAKAFYEGLAPNLEFVGMDLKDSRYKGVGGLEHVYHDLRALNPDMVADLHDVLRTKYARIRFRMAGIPVAFIAKNRSARKEITRAENKVLRQQATSFEKYKAVFCRLGLDFTVPDEAPLRPGEASVEVQGEAVGIAPFAAHDGKIYPVDRMETVILTLRKEHPELKIYLFGGGPRDKAQFGTWCSMYNNVYYAGEYCRDMGEELALMSRMKCMVTMDSGNMHLASLVGTPVVSVWGATHPFAGFMGWQQKKEDIVQAELPCRPCSIYGNKPCMRGDYACLNSIKPEEIVRKVGQYLGTA
ncbi:MAG: glycosyltransferase family 9 protein [Bacteroidales bacterium]|nr:glycosyltransferase family 9 protein [Bacteroidales bacterium]MCM1146508.1 glycosyltransferase family 9 protein [Bacteroidales bacterium]MCM1207226.1 glycosyltransferase family 9 protein [Bacillota bacterium]MCM1509300.1 glycosyltransferase family 9 protein [Clostridium sp.]